MDKFTYFSAVAVPVPVADVDTDQIIPARFLRKRRSEGFGQYLFHDLLFNADGSRRQDFALGTPRYGSSRIIVAQTNFGCGSSREEAVWALYDYGIRAIIAPSFGDIFYNNSLQNGLLPIVQPHAVVVDFLHLLMTAPAEPLTMSVDLDAETLTGPSGVQFPFDVPPFAKHCLLNGIDEIGFTLSQIDQIIAFEQVTHNESHN
jgi:3-isopropylmalate/(R)-2-methylmalate dehydratase small subunit